MCNVPFSHIQFGWGFFYWGTYTLVQEVWIVQSSPWCTLQLQASYQINLCPSENFQLHLIQNKKGALDPAVKQLMKHLMCLAPHTWEGIEMFERPEYWWARKQQKDIWEGIYRVKPDAQVNTSTNYFECHNLLVFSSMGYFNENTFLGNNSRRQLGGCCLAFSTRWQGNYTEAGAHVFLPILSLQSFPS